MCLHMCCLYAFAEMQSRQIHVPLLSLALVPCSVTVKARSHREQDEPLNKNKRTGFRVLSTENSFASHLLSFFLLLEALFESLCQSHLSLERKAYPLQCCFGE